MQIPPIYSTSVAFNNRSLLSETMTDMKSLHTSGKRDVLHLSNASPILESTPLELVDSATNSINIQPSIVYSLGQVNGKALDFRFLPGGGIETNFSPMIHFSGQGTVVTQEQMDALQAFKSYTNEEHQRAIQLTQKMKQLTDVAAGRKNLDDFNRLSSPGSTSVFLQSIGIDVSRTFSLNGTVFRLGDGGVLNQL